MKKSMRKLSLHRETLGSLQGTDLSLIAGAGTTMACMQPSDCQCESEGCVAPTGALASCSCYGTRHC